MWLRGSRLAYIFAAVLAAVLVLAACGGPSASSALATATKAPSLSNKTSTALKLVHPGYLTVGSDTTYPPMESKSPSGFVGADVDLANALAKQMRLKGAKIVSAGFDSLIPSLQAKRFDVIMSSMNDTPDRAKKVAFVDYMTATMGILVPKSSSIHSNSFSGLCGHSVSVERGTVEQDDLNAANAKCSKKINILVSGADSDAHQAFVSGHADAYTSDLPVIAYYVHKDPARYRMAGKAISAHANYGIALNKGDSKLKSALQTALGAIRASGQYGRILKRWGVADAALK